MCILKPITSKMSTFKINSNIKFSFMLASIICWTFILTVRDPMHLRRISETSCSFSQKSLVGFDYSYIGYINQVWKNLQSNIWLKKLIANLRICSKFCTHYHLPWVLSPSCFLETLSTFLSRAGKWGKSFYKVNSSFWYNFSMCF